MAKQKQEPKKGRAKGSKAHELEYLIIHCTATPEGREVSEADVRRWHTAPKPKGRGWKQVGYTAMFHLDGSMTTLVKHNDDNIVDTWERTNGALGMNHKSRHIVYVGGCDENMKAKDTRTDKQKKALEEYVKSYTNIHPNWKIAGHYHFASKACPSFNVEEWLEEIGIDERNIYRK